MTDTRINLNVDDMSEEEQQSFREQLKAELAEIEVSVQIPEGVSYAAIMAAAGSLVTSTIVECIEPGDYAQFVEKLFDFVCYTLDRHLDAVIQQDADDQAYENNAPEDVLDVAAHGFDDDAVEGTGL